MGKGGMRGGVGIRGWKEKGVTSLWWTQWANAKFAYVREEQLRKGKDRPKIGPEKELIPTSRGIYKKDPKKH